MARRPATGRIRDTASGIAARLAALGCDPVTIMAGIAMDESADARLRFYAAKELASYVHPRATSQAMPPGAEADVGGIIAGAWSEKAAETGRPKPTADAGTDGAGGKE